MRLIHKLRLFCGVSWLRTIYFNFRYLPYRQAIRLPILLYHPEGICGNGLYVIDVPLEEIKFGMLKLGVKNEESVLTKTGVVISNFGTLIFKGAGVLGNGCSLIIGNQGRLSIGKNFGITGDVSIHCYDSIEIGAFFSCSWNVTIDDTDHHKLMDLDNNKEKEETKPIKIGDYVWLCQHVSVFKGSELPAWTIVSSNSLVNKRYLVSPYSVLAGMPAKDTGKKLKRMDIEGFITKQNWYITEGLKIFNC